MVQTTLTGFLSPPPRRQGSQSSSTPPPGQASPKGREHSTPDLPKRTKKKSKRVLKGERKKERRRAKLMRKCKENATNADISTVSTQITPMPSPSHCDDFNIEINPCDTDEHILLTDRSLTDLLASADAGDHSNDSSHDKSTMPESNEEMILRLEAKLLATNNEIQAEINERISLQNQVELLVSEIDTLKKTDKNQKSEIKKLTNENDKLRKDISRVSGIRRHVEANLDTPTRCAISTQTAETGDLYIKYNKLKSNLVGITESLISALDDDDDIGFTVTSRSKRVKPLPPQWCNYNQCDKQLPVNSLPSSSRQPETQCTTPVSRLQNPRHTVTRQSRSSASQSRTHHPLPQARSQPPSSPSGSHARQGRPEARPHTAASHQQPQRIPVVEIGAAARSAASTAGVRPGPDTSPPVDSSNETIIIGSSLVNGLGPKLRSMGIDATCYMYRGGDIPTIQSRIPHILKPGTSPKNIVLQVGGNDATRQDPKNILARYESLIRDIKRRCPYANVILSKVPPRKGTFKTMSAINEINSHLDLFSERMHNVSAVDVCPRSVHYFRKDCTHFNRHGLNDYAKELADALRNFHQSSPVTHT